MDLDGQQLAGTRLRTSEALTHFGIMKRQPACKSCVHAHPPHALVFAATHRPIPCVSEAFYYYGVPEIPVCIPALSGTPQLSASVLGTFGTHPSSHSTYAAVIPDHGVVVAAPDLDVAYSILDGAESMARVALLRKLLE